MSAYTLDPNWKPKTFYLLTNPEKTQEWEFSLYSEVLYLLADDAELMDIILVNYYSDLVGKDYSWLLDLYIEENIVTYAQDMGYLLREITK